MTDRPDTNGWLRFWGGDHPIYVNARHAEAHCRRIAEDVCAAIGGRAPGRVLDWGCGDSLSAELIARRCGELLLYDAVGPVRARLEARFVGAERIRLLDPAGWATLPADSIDAIVLVSVAQYLSQAEFSALLADFHRILRADGEIILGDIVPADASSVADTCALLETAIRHGFLLAALHGLARTVFSDYRRLRRGLGFSRYGETEFMEILAAHGFAATRLPVNIGFNRWRMSFRARKRPRPSEAARPG